VKALKKVFNVGKIISKAKAIPAKVITVVVWE